MATGDLVGNITCKCGGAVPIVEGKGGTLSGRCPAPDCGAQTLVRSPAAVARWRAAFNAGREPSPADVRPSDQSPVKKGGSGLLID